MKANEGLRAVASQVHSNPRLAIGLSVAGGILLVWLALVLAEALERKRKAIAELERQSARIARIESEPEWARRAAELAELADAFRSDIRNSASQGIALAELQGDLERISRPHIPSAGFGRVEVSESDALPGVQVACATINGRTTPASALAWVEAIEEHTTLLRISRLRFPLGASGNLQAEVCAYFEVQPTLRSIDGRNSSDE